MSEEFIQYRFPCNTCLVQAACRDRDRMSIKDTKINHEISSLGVPLFKDKDKSWHKGLLECMLNLQKQIMDKVSRTEGKEDFNKQETDRLPMQYIYLMIDMSQILCHMANSTSWREGELFEFDRIEIKRRLTRLTRWL